VTREISAKKFILIFAKIHKHKSHVASLIWLSHFVMIPNFAKVEGADHGEHRAQLPITKLP